MSSLVESVPSLAVSRSTYVPAALKVALVLDSPAFPNVTVPGPLNFVHAVVRVLPVGRPSSLAVPVRLAVAGRVMARSAPALTVGAWFTGGGGVTVLVVTTSWQGLTPASRELKPENGLAA